VPNQRLPRNQASLAEIGRRIAAAVTSMFDEARDGEVSGFVPEKDWLRLRFLV